MKKHNTQQNPVTSKAQESWSKTREHLRAALKRQADLAKAKKRPKFNFVNLPEQFNADTREACLRALEAAEQVLIFNADIAKVAMWFNTRYAYYANASVNAPAPKQAPARVEPKRKHKATKAERVQAAKMRVAKSVHNLTDGRKELNALARLIGFKEAEAYERYCIMRNFDSVEY